GLIDMAVEAEQACPAVLRSSHCRKGFAAIANDRGRGAECFYIIKYCGALKRSRYCRKRRANARNAALAFKRFQQCRFLSDFIRSGAGLGIAVEMKIRAAQVIAQITAVVSLSDRLIPYLSKVAVFPAELSV